MRLILILLAIAIAGGVTWYVTQVSQQPATLTEAPRTEREIVREPTISVIVATKSLPAGRLLKKDDVGFQSWPESAVRTEYLTEKTFSSPEELAGAVTRMEIVKGEPLLPEKIVRAGERGYLAAVLRPGMKAVSIPVNERTGVGGFVLPGDLVDVILTQTIIDNTVSTDRNENFSRQTSETIIRNARVLGSGQNTGKPAEGAAIVVATVTLELTPKLAEIVTLANEIGRLSLALNPLLIDETAEGEIPVAAEEAEIFPYLVEGVDDQSFYSFSMDVDASPVRGRTYSGSSGGDGSSVQVVRKNTTSTSVIVHKPSATENELRNSVAP